MPLPPTRRAVAPALTRTAFRDQIQSERPDVAHPTDPATPSEDNDPMPISQVNAVRGMLCALALSALCCGPQTEPPKEKRNLILISIDTWRWDRTAIANSELATTPFLKELAGSGTTFTSAYAQFHGTLPSHASLFTGLYPEEHAALPPTGKISPEHPTLPELFQAAGYATGGFTEGGYASGHFGFSRGFGEFDDSASGGESDIETTFQRGLDFLDAVPADQNFFLFLHTYSVHDPYEPSPEYLDLFWSGERPDVFRPTGPNLSRVNSGELTLSREGLNFFERSYEASLRYADHQLRGLWQQLASRSLLEDTVVVLTSDHGEEFLDHGKLVHTQSYPETIQVPLLVIGPGWEAGKRVDHLVELVDITTTVVADFGLGDSSRLSGSPLPRTGEAPDQTAHSTEMAGTSVLVFDTPEIRYFARFRDYPEDTWVQQEVVLDRRLTADTIQLQTFHRPREVIVTIDGNPSQRVTIDDNSWTGVELPPEGSTVAISSMTCDRPVDVGINQDGRCLAFRVRGGRMAHLELFNLDEDPYAREPLSGSDEARETALRHFRDFRRGLRSPPDGAGASLPQDVAEQLRKLGYIN